MLAVWSFWSPPSDPAFSARWPAPEFHLMSWVLSVCQAKKVFRETALITDKGGADILVEKLGLRFDEVSTSLDSLPYDHKRYWALGKLHAYKVQTQPFIHIDSDVYFWKPLPNHVTGADILAQNTEKIGSNSYYKHERVLTFLREKGGWIPREVEWYSDIEGNEAICCGILGGKRFELLNDFANMAIDFISKNHLYLRSIDKNIEINIIAEQYFLSAFLYYGLTHLSSRYEGINLEYLFTSEYEARNTQTPSVIGYTHVLAGAKHSPSVINRLSSRIQQQYPEYYERCKTLGESIANGVIRI